MEIYELSFRLTLEHMLIYWVFCLILIHGLEESLVIKWPSVMRVIVNQCVGTQLCVYLWLRYGNLNDQVYFCVWEFLFKLPVMFMVEHVLFYAIHKLFHTKFLYTRFHSIHHKWTYPVPYAAVDAHLVEHIKANVGPILWAPVICQASLQTARVWTWIATCNAVLSHSGYELGGEHDMHHRLRNCNYGLAGFYFDKFMGTYQPARPRLETKHEKHVFPRNIPNKELL